MVPGTTGRLVGPARSGATRRDDDPRLGLDAALQKRMPPCRSCAEPASGCRVAEAIPAVQNPPGDPTDGVSQRAAMSAGRPHVIDASKLSKPRVRRVEQAVGFATPQVSFMTWRG